MPSFKCHDCKTEIPGTNCAYQLSYEMGWKAITGCAWYCKCKYPIRAKELRDNKFSFIDGDKKSTKSAYIYCENPSGQGHVYFGTFDTCDKGNGYTAKQMQENNTGTIKFGRYTAK